VTVWECREGKVVGLQDRPSRRKSWCTDGACRIHICLISRVYKHKGKLHSLEHKELKVI